MTEPTPAWAQSVDAFSSAQRQSVAASSATSLQFPDTSQLGGVCGQLLGGSSMTSGLMAAGDSSQGTAGSLVSGTQFFSDLFCGLMGGTGTDTSPQQIAAGGQDVADAVNTTPMTSGTIAAGGSTGNSALDAINGLQNLSNQIYSILAGCGCAPQLAPDQVSPQQIVDTTQQTSDGITGSPMASGIISMGQDPTGSGNVALDAINGTQNFADGLMSILTACGCLQPSSGISGTSQLGPLTLGAPYTATNVSPGMIIDVAQAASDAVTSNPFAADLLGVGSGNLAVDALTSGQDLADQVHTAVSGALTSGSSLQDVATAGSHAINQNNAHHVAHTSLTTAQSVNLKKQNLLVSENFSTPYTFVAAETHWSYNGVDGATSPGCVQVICDGTQSDLVSNEIPVVANETIEMSCMVDWTGLTYTGDSPIILAVEKYRIGNAPGGGKTYLDLGGTTVAAAASPGASSGGWVGIAGTYVVEPGVDQIRTKFLPAANATAGTIKWDDAEFLKIDLISDECVPGVGMTTDDIVTQLYGTAGAGFTHNQSAVALGNTAAAILSNTAGIAALQAADKTGAIAADDFNWVGPVAGEINWSGQYTLAPGDGGHYNADGIQAVWVPEGGDSAQTGQFMWVGTDPASSTDYQLVQLVLASAPAADLFDDYGRIHLIGRIGAGFNGSTVARINSNGTWQVGYYTSSFGTFTVLQSGTCAVPGHGAIISFYLGDALTASPRHFRLEVGTLTVGAFDEVGTGSPLGAPNRGYGWGFTAQGSGWPWGSQGAPPNIDTWLGMDQ